MDEIVYKYTGQELWYHKPIKNMLPYVSDLLKMLNIHYWIDWGTLLGAIRNGKIIPWDFDIDIGIFHKDVVKLLDAENTIGKDGYEFAVDRNRKYARKIRFFGKEGFDFHIDIDPWDVSTNGDYAFATFDYSKKCPTNEIIETGTIIFEDAEYPCPKNPENRLSRLVGPDWKIPKVGSGNVIYIKKYAPDNIDILEEIKKYGGC